MLSSSPMSSIRSAASGAPLFLLTFSFPRATHAQAANSSSCTNTDFLSYNATGSITFAGFQPPELGTNSTWTLSTAVVEKPNPAFSPPTAQMLQTFFLTTTPFVDLSAPELPLTGCVIALAASGNPSSSGSAQNGCAGVLASSCQQAIIEQVNNQSLANSGSGPSTNATCEAFLSTVPQACQDAGNAWKIIGVSGTDLVFPPLSRPIQSSHAHSSRHPRHRFPRQPPLSRSELPLARRRHARGLPRTAHPIPQFSALE